MSTADFNWQEENASDTFRAWFLLRLISTNELFKGDVHQTLENLTDGWRDVQVEIRINGVALDAGVFIDSLEETIDSLATREAQKTVSKVPGFDDLYSMLHDVEEMVKAQVRERVESAGLEFIDDREF